MAKGETSGVGSREEGRTEKDRRGRRILEKEGEKLREGGGIVELELDRTFCYLSLKCFVISV